MDRLSFENGNITFTCEAGGSPATPGTMWWWVTFTGESVRHAAFQKGKGDTQENVKSRVLGYYQKLLYDRARPAITRGNWGRPPAKKE
jgi:hypothetical protein